MKLKTRCASQRSRSDLPSLAKMHPGVSTEVWRFAHSDSRLDNRSRNSTPWVPDYLLLKEMW